LDIWIYHQQNKIPAKKSFVATTRGDASRHSNSWDIFPLIADKFPFRIPIHCPITALRVDYLVLQSLCVWMWMSMLELTAVHVAANSTIAHVAKPKETSGDD
jgi:hypothetical protein